MGDMADYQKEWDYDDDYWDLYGNTSIIPPTKQTCKYCKARNLHWVRFENKWRLFNSVNKLHCCIIIK